MVGIEYYPTKKINRGIDGTDSPALKKMLFCKQKAVLPLRIKKFNRDQKRKKMINFIIKYKNIKYLFHIKPVFED
ncbi:MAG: hypothetical protein COB67_13065 [SAR324 cluster bacterium]|uniref:Uncharacterized protein n=1 Tax=SAR324 cluster bacterium TaxID=2024889 RepID=A0A2A4SPB2_9DELT|nr:MAG: hypothetical protein COB67_13065 [SAR324 cluster bacterium]